MSIRREFMIADSENNKRIDINAFKKFCKDYRINLDENEINMIFAELDENKDGTLNYQEFIKGIIGDMNERRKKIVLQAFQSFDKNGNGIIELDDIRDTYNAKMHPDVKSGKKTEEEVYTEFMDTFRANHILKAGPRSKRVTYEEFLDYYNNISMTINDDDYFVFLIQNAWKLNPYAYSKPRISYLEEEDNEKKVNISNINKVNNYRNRDFNTTQVPLSIGQRQEKTNMNEKVPLNKKSKSEEVIEKLRNIISKRGSRGIMSIRREFMIADSENNKRINIDSFKKFCHDYRIDLLDNEINLLFAELDLNKDGTIDYQEFLKGVIGEMNERRKRIVQQAFKAIDKNGIGLIELDDIRESYNAKMHPDVLSGKKTEEEALAEFLDTFEYQFSLLSDEKENETKIGLEEFIDYYNNISLGIKDDAFFEEMIKNVYNLDSRKNNKKIW